MANEIKSTDFFEGGNATFTVGNDSKHYTFRIRKPKPDMPFFVGLLSGSDNESSYTYMGVYVPQNKNIYIKGKSKFNDESTPVKTFRWAIKQIVENATLPDGWVIKHEGKCCRCGRKLTTPESIENGIGAKCAGMMQWST